MDLMAKNINTLMGLIKVLVVDDEQYSRKVIRTLLMSLGVTKIFDAYDGPSGLDAICQTAPEIVLLDWQLPGFDGAEFVRRVRAPERFPLPDVPIIMLTGHGERSRVIEAVQSGVHEFLLKPVSSKALRARILAVLTKPRNMIRRGDYYGPEPRKLSTYKPEYELPADRIVDRSPNYMIFVN